MVHSVNAINSFASAKSRFFVVEMKVWWIIVCLSVSFCDGQFFSIFNLNEPIILIDLIWSIWSDRSDVMGFFIHHHRLQSYKDGRRHSIDLFLINFQFNWTEIVETLLSTVGLNEEDRSALNISEMPINLQCHEFLPELSNLIASTPRRLFHQSTTYQLQTSIIADEKSMIIELSKSKILWPFEKLTNFILTW